MSTITSQNLEIKEYTKIKGKKSTQQPSMHAPTSTITTKLKRERRMNVAIYCNVLSTKSQIY